MLPYQNGKVEVKEVDKNNNGMFAKQLLKPWYPLLEIKPLFSALLGELRDKFCSNCMIQKNVSRCTGCKVMYYCSRDCQKEDWEYHKHECSIYKKMIQEMKVKNQKITAEFSVNLRAWLSRHKNKEIEDKFQKMRCLLEFQREEKIKQMQELAFALIYNLGVQKSEENISKMMRQICIISINGFTVQDYLCNRDAIGVAVYFPTNFFNHSCHPNCLQIFDGKILKIVPKRKIQPKQQLTISYILENKDLPYRKQILRKEYYFQCFCEYCQIDSMFDWQVFYILCPNCHNRSLIKGQQKNKIDKLKEQFHKDNNSSDEEEQKKQQNDKNIIYCKQCEKQIAYGQIKEIEHKIKEGNEIICGKQVSYEAAKKAYFDIKKFVHESDPNLAILLNNVYILCLEKAYSQPKLYSQAYILLKDMIEKMPSRFRVDLEQEEIPYTYVWKYAEMGKLSFNLNKKKKAWEFTEKAWEIVKKINFTNKFVEVVELRERYEQLKVSLSFEKTEIFRK